MVSSRLVVEIAFAPGQSAIHSWSFPGRDRPNYGGAPSYPYLRVCTIGTFVVPTHRIAGAATKLANFDDYGVGGFLLAGSEVYQLATE